VNEVIMHLLGYLNEGQWKDALKHDAQNVEPIIRAVEKQYNCKVIDMEKWRTRHNLDV